MKQNIIFLLTTLMTLTATSMGLEIVFDLPGKLYHSTLHNVILSTFEGTAGERLTVSIQLHVQTTNLRIFNHQENIVLASSVDTHSFPLRVSPTSRNCQRTTISSSYDTLCMSSFRVSVTTSSGRNWSTSKIVPIVARKAHIFIETDRPVYRPGDSVHVRFIPVDDLLRPLQSPMMMIISAPNPTPGGERLVSWKKTKAASNGIFVRTFRLPSTPPIGKWSIVARFNSHEMVQNDFVSAFYVQDYSLPSFDVTIEAINSFILPDDQTFSFRLGASYIHGEQLEAVAHLRFGLLSTNGEREMLTTHIVKKRHFTGAAVVAIAVQDLVGSSNISQLCSFNTPLFIEASVTGSGQGRTRVTRDKSVIFTDSPIVLSLDKTPSFFKPGLPFGIQATAKYANGKEAPNIDVVVVATEQRGDADAREIFRETLPTCTEGGSLLTHFTAPVTSNRLLLTASAQFTSGRGSSYPIRVEKQLTPQTSTYGEHIHILLPRKDLVVGSMAPVEIYVTPSTRPKTIVYTITGGENLVTKGKVAVIPRGDQSMITFRVTAEMSPVSRMTAYYVTQTSAGVFFITADSTILRVVSTCRGTEPQMNVALPQDLLPYPGQQLNIEVRGQPSAYVGLTGVDVAALSLKKDYFDGAESKAVCSRANAFNVLRSFTPGCHVPTAPTPEHAFETIGRTLATSASNGDPERSALTCGESSTSKKRKRRDLLGDNSLLLEKASRFTGNQYECCAIGARDVRQVMTFDDVASTCEQRSNTVTLSEACRSAFKECCLEAQCIRDHPRNREACRQAGARRTSLGRGVFVASSGFGASSVTVVERTAQLLRSNFDHTWFLANFRLRSSNWFTLNNDSTPRVPQLPDSITSWSVGVFSLSPEHGMCVLEPFSFAVDHTLYVDVRVPSGTIVRGTQISVEATVYSYVDKRVEARLSMEPVGNICDAGEEDNNIFKSLHPSYSGVPSTAVARFTIIPMVQGEYKITITMRATVGNSAKPIRVEKVIKTIKVVPEGQPERVVRWILVDNRPRRGKKRQTGSNRRNKVIKLPLPSNAIPGTETATVRLHTLSSAVVSNAGSSASTESDTTIAPYVYSLQGTVSKLRYLQAARRLTPALTEQLITSAQNAYNGILSFVRDLNVRRADQSATVSLSNALYGIAYSPTSISEPDLWLTSATVRLLVEATELIEPDNKILQGCLRWVLSHQVQKRGKAYGFFSGSSTIAQSRLRRTPCGKIRIAKLRKRCKVRRNADRLRLRLPQFSTNRDRKIYRTALIATEIDIIRKVVDAWAAGRKQPLGSDEIDSDNRLRRVNTAAIRSSLRRAIMFVGRQVVPIRNTEASPVTLTASAQFLHLARGNSARALPGLRSAILRHRRTKTENDVQTWWIQSNRADIRTLTKTQRLQVESASVEATANQLYRLTLGDSNPEEERYANWLIEAKSANGRWVSLRDSVAAMQALGQFALRSASLNRNVRSLQLEVADPSAGTPRIIAPAEVDREVSPANQADLSVQNNAVSLTSLGTGSAWIELDVNYNIAKSRSRRSAPSAPPTTLAVTRTTSAQVVVDEHVCPYNVTVNVITGSPLAPFTVTRSLRVSSFVYEVHLSVAFTADQVDDESDDQTYVVDFGLHSNYQPLEEDLEQLSNVVEKAVDHYRLSQRALLLYMNGEKKIAFRLRGGDSYNAHPIPIHIYPAAFPERRCTSYYNVKASSALLRLCSTDDTASLSSGDVCACAAGETCAKILKRSASELVSSDWRKTKTCNQSTTYAYKVRIVGDPDEREDWTVYTAKIRTIYKKAGLDGMGTQQNHTFWLKATCFTQRQPTISTNREYFISGSTVIQDQDGVYRHLLDSKSRVEWWPTRNCARYSSRQTSRICKLLGNYDYTMRTRGCRA